MRSVAILLALCCGVQPAMAPAMADERMAFWNLTSFTITNLVMAPAGSAEFGANQCANDRDGSVDHDERLRLAGVAPGRYDVRLTTKPGRVCMIRNVELKSGGKYAFSLSDSDLTDCR